MLVALVMATPVLGQTGDAFACNNETEASAASADEASMAVAVGTHHENQTPERGNGVVCQHDHCHHGISIAQRLEAPEVVLVATTPFCGRDVAVADGRLSNIDYPPRA